MYCRLLTQAFMLLIFFPFMAQVECAAFSVDLIHRDSKHSPFYNKSISQSELLAKEVQRSYARVNILNSSSNYRNEIGMESMVEGYEETYLAKYDLGSDKHEVIAFVSTTTNFVWTKCQWLNQDAESYVRNRPVYETIQSNDYRCTEINDFRLQNTLPSCQYIYPIDERVYSKGELGEDAFYFHSSRADPENMQMMRTYFGCSFENRGFNKEVQGVLALGRGSTSLVSQYRNANRIYMFSYCLRPTKDVGLSSLKFGIYPDKKYQMVTSALRGGNVPSRYYLQLDSVSVGDREIPTPYNYDLMAIDIGNPMTFLTKFVYLQFDREVRKKISVNKRPSKGFKLCFEDNQQNQKLASNIIEFNFDRASFRLGIHAYVKIDDTLCMAILPTDSRESILGSLAQVHHVMHFYLLNRYLSFTRIPVDCANF